MYPGFLGPGAQRATIDRDRSAGTRYLVPGADCMVPSGLAPGCGCVVFRLGRAFTGTKAKREQFGIVWQSRDPDVYDAMLRLLAVTHDEDDLFPTNNDQYRRLLDKAQVFLFGARPGMHLTPHSWRGAFVVDGLLASRSSGELRTEGRWASESVQNLCRRRWSFGRPGPHQRHVRRGFVCVCDRRPLE